MNNMKALGPHALPGTANRAAKPEVCLTVVRDADGRFLRLADQAQTDRLIEGRAAAWHGYGSERHLRLRVALPPNSLRTLSGKASTRESNPSALYHHNARACEQWAPDARPKAQVAHRIAAANRERVAGSRS